MDNTTKTLAVVGVLGVGGYFLLKNLGGEAVPLWFTGTLSQIDALYGSGMSKDQVDEWLDVAYDRVYKTLKDGQFVAWSAELGYYADYY